MFSKISNTFHQELPKFDSLDKGVDFLMTYLYRFSEDLYDVEFYNEIRWLEIRDDMHFQESILHIFKSNGQYLRILDGDISTGTWENQLGGLTLQINGLHELYECTFLNESFFILKKHGDHSSKGLRSKYFFLCRESIGARYQWPELLSILYEVYRSNTQYKSLVFLFLILVGLILFYSMF